MESIPTNMIQYIIGAPVFALFAWRGYKNYKRLHNPLSGYFALSGLLAAATFAIWGFPLFFTQDLTFLAYDNAFADLFLYALYVVSADLVHYLALRQRVSRAVFITPFIILAVIGSAIHAYGYIHNGVSIVNNEFVYDLPVASIFIQLIMLINIMLVGVFLLAKLGQQDSSRGRFGLTAVGILYLLSGLAGTLNVVLAENFRSSLIVGAYLSGFLFFVAILLVTRFRKSSSPPSPTQPQPPVK